MARMSLNDRSYARAAVREERSVGEHIFIWIAWAVAAAFWGASLTTMVEIFRAAGRALPVTMASAPGGSGYLILVVAAFLALALSIAYASIRSATSRSGGVREVATAALYDSVERQRGEEVAARSAEQRRREADFR
jgi:hypothetical protein